MTGLRAVAIAEVDAAVATGDLKNFADWPRVIAEPILKGTYGEGDEFEGELAAGEKPWIVDADADAVAADTADLEAAAEKKVKGEEGDDTKELADADVLANRLEQLKRLRAVAVEANQARAATDATTEIRQLHRGLSGKRKQANNILRRRLQNMLDVEREVLAGKRKRIRADNSRKEKLRRHFKLGNAKKVAKAAARKAHEKLLMDIPAMFTSKDCGQGGKQGQTARKQVLERLRLRAPLLPLSLEMIWKVRRDAFAKQMARVHGVAVGSAFINEVNACLRALGVHYRGKTEYNGKGVLTGDAKAFEKFVRVMGAFLPAPAKSVTL
jgi:hypothetical protein